MLDLVGTWELLSYERVEADGSVSSRPFGEAPVGRLVYTADGAMSAVLARSDRGPGEDAFIGYSGRWRLEGTVVTHEVVVAHLPEWIGGVQIRHASREGDELTLSAHRGTGRSLRLRWRRVGFDDAARRGFVTVAGARIHYRTWGEPSARPPVLLLHGALHSSVVWEVVAPALAADRLVVAPDLRGHGASTRPSPSEAGAYALAAVAGDVAGLVLELGLERPVVVGQSYGAAVALELARLGPEPGGLVMVEPPLRLSDGRSRAALEAAVPMLALGRGELVRAVTRQLATTDPRVAEALADALLSADPEVARAAVDSAAATGDLLHRLPGPEVPWLVLRADPGLSLIPEEVAAALEPARVVVVEGSGPGIPFDAPGRFTEAVLAFAAEI